MSSQNWMFLFVLIAASVKILPEKNDSNDLQYSDR